MYTINISNFKCPQCQRTGQYHEENYEITCECGLIISTPYPYTAGQRIKTLSDYQIEQETKRRKKQCKQTI